jgi:hypothetical protein
VPTRAARTKTLETVSWEYTPLQCVSQSQLDWESKFAATMLTACQLQQSSSVTAPAAKDATIAKGLAYATVGSSCGHLLDCFYKDDDVMV